MSLKKLLNSFPKTTNIKKWENYLERELEDIEKKLLEELKKEVIINRMLKNLFINLKKEMKIKMKNYIFQS